MSRMTPRVLFAAVLLCITVLPAREAAAQANLINDGNIEIGINQLDMDQVLDLRQLLLQGGQPLLESDPLASITIAAVGQCLVTTPPPVSSLGNSCVTIRWDTNVAGCSTDDSIVDDPATNGLTFQVTAKTGEADTGTLFMNFGSVGFTPGGACTALPENSPPTADQPSLQNLQVSGSPPGATIALSTAIQDLDTADQITVSVSAAPANGSLVLAATGAPVAGPFNLQDVRYLPADPANFPGDTVVFLADDGNGGTVTASATIAAVSPQAWTTTPDGVAVSPADICAAGAEGLTCDLVPGEEVTFDLADVVSAPEAGLTYTFDATVVAADDSGADVGSITPEAGSLTPGTQTLLTYTMPATNRTAAQILINITDNLQRTSTLFASVGVAEQRSVTPRATTPNQAAVATRIDFICPLLQAQNADPNDPSRPPELAGQPLTEGESQLLRQCNNLMSIETSDEEVRDALRAIMGEEIAAQKRSVVDIGKDQNRFLASRVASLRGGATGVSLAGLNVSVDGKTLPLSLLEPTLTRALGAAAGADDPDSIASRLGVFVQGKVTFGDKRETALESGFDFDGTLFMAGVDYRFSPDFVVGVSGSYGNSDVEFARDGGRLDSDDYALGVYGFWYPFERLYIDFLGSFGKTQFDQTRVVSYTTSGSQYRSEALGSTDGDQLSVGVNIGYDITRAGFSFTPALKLFAVDGEIDGFAEGGPAPTAGNPDARAWDLEFASQEFRSVTAAAGAQLAYAWLPKWGVVRPYVRADYVRELEDDGDVLIVRLVHDFQDSGATGSANGPITVTTDDPDSSYFTFGAGLSLQMPRGVSGFIDYQRLEAYEDFRSESLTLGLRFELSF